MPLRKQRGDNEGLAIPGGLFIGMGIGFLTNNFVAWTFIGFGLGFIAMLLLRMKKKR